MDDQPNPLSLPEAPPRRRNDRADRPGIEVPPSPPVLPDPDRRERGRGPGEPPPHSRLRGALRYGLLLLVVAALVLWLVFRGGPQAPAAGALQSGRPMA